MRREAVTEGTHVTGEKPRGLWGVRVPDQGGGLGFSGRVSGRVELRTGSCVVMPWEDDTKARQARRLADLHTGRRDEYLSR